MASIPGFIGGYNVAYSKAFGGAICNNLYPEPSKDPTSTTGGALYGTPGTTLISAWDTTGWSAPDSGGRGIYVSSRGIMYGVTGEIVWKYGNNEAVAPTQITTIPYATTTVRFADDGNYVSLVDGNNLYAIDMYSDSVSTPTLPTNVHPTHVCFLAGRTIINSAPYVGAISPGAAPVDTRLYYSAQYDATTWLTNGAGSFAAITSSDPCTAIDVVNDQLIAIGPRSTEFFGVTDEILYPYQRVTGSGSVNGIYAPSSLATAGKQSYWLGLTTNGSVQVYRNNGYDIETVSTPAIEWAFATSGNNSPIDAIGGTYAQAGHVFYVLTSRFMNITFVYDMVTNIWHTRSSRNLLGEEGYWRYLYFASNYGKTYSQVYDYQGVMKIDLSVYKEFDNRTITRERGTGILGDSMNNIVHDNLVLLMETGTGDSAGTDTKDPIVTLSYSDDANGNWSPEITGYIGNDGLGGGRVRWDRLAFARQRSYRIRITAPVRVVLMDAFINMRSLNR